MLILHAKKYFQAFENKDLMAIRPLLSHNVYLRDWENEAHGIENVILLYEKIFNSTKSIQISLVNLFTQENTVIGELHINIDGCIHLKVVDILYFSNLKKINSIRAYKG